MLFLTIENVFENFGRRKIARLRDLLARLVSVTLKQKLQTSELSSIPVNKTMLVFANVFTVNVHHT